MCSFESSMDKIAEGLCSIGDITGDYFKRLVQRCPHCYYLSLVVRLRAFGREMILNKLRIIASLTAAIEAEGHVDFGVNCARWDTILNLHYGATKLHLKAAANAAGYDMIEGFPLIQLKYRTAL